MLFRFLWLAFVPAVLARCVRLSPLVDEAFVIYSIKESSFLTVTALIPCESDSLSQNLALEQQAIASINIASDIRRVSTFGSDPFQIVSLTPVGNGTIANNNAVIVLALHFSTDGLSLSVTNFNVANNSGTFTATPTWFDTDFIGDFSQSDVKTWQSKVELSKTGRYLLVRVGPFISLWERDANIAGFAFVNPSKVSCAPLLLNRNETYEIVESWTASDFSHDDKFLALGSSNLFTLKQRGGLADCDIRKPAPAGQFALQGTLEFSSQAIFFLINEAKALTIIQQVVFILSLGGQFDVEVVRFEPTSPLSVRVFFNIFSTDQKKLSDLETALGGILAQTNAVLALFGSAIVLSEFSVGVRDVHGTLCLSGLTPFPQIVDAFIGAMDFFLQGAFVNRTATLNPNHPPFVCIDAAIEAAANNPVGVTAATSDVFQLVIAAFVAGARGITDLRVSWSIGAHTLEWNTTELDKNYAIVYDIDRLMTKRDCDVIDASTSAVVTAVHSCLAPIADVRFAPEDDGNVTVLAIGMDADGLVRALSFNTTTTAFVGVQNDQDLALRQSLKACSICTVAEALTDPTQNQCADDVNFVDRKGHECSFWANLTCESDASKPPFDFEPFQVTELLQRCSLSCRKCIPANTSGVSCSGITDLTCASCLSKMTPSRTCASATCFDQTVISGVPSTLRELCFAQCITEAQALLSCAPVSDSTDQCSGATGGKFQLDVCPTLLSEGTLRSSLNQRLVPVHMVWDLDGFMASIRINSDDAIFGSHEATETLVNQIETNTPPLKLGEFVSGQLGGTTGMNKVISRDIFQTFSGDTITYRKFSDTSLLFSLTLASPFAFGQNTLAVWQVQPDVDSFSHGFITRSIFSSLGSFRCLMSFSSSVDLQANMFAFDPPNIISAVRLDETIPEHEWLVTFQAQPGTQPLVSLAIKDAAVVNSVALDTAFVVDNIPPSPVLTLRISTPPASRTGCDAVTNNAIADVLISYGERVQEQCFERDFSDKLQISSSTSDDTLLQLSTNFIERDPTITCGGLVCNPFDHNNTCAIVLATPCDECTIVITATNGSVLDLAQNANLNSPSVRLCVDRISPTATLVLTDLDGNTLDNTRSTPSAFLFVRFNEPVFEFRESLLFCDTNCIVAGSFQQTDRSNQVFRVELALPGSSSLKVFSGARDLAGNLNLGVELVVSPLPTLSLLSDGTLIGVYVATLIILLLVLLVTGLVLKFFKEKELRQTTPLFSLFILAGLACTCISNLLFGRGMHHPAQHVRDRLCEGGVWFQIISVALFLGSLVTRNYRIWKLFDNKKLQLISVTVKDLVAMQGTLMTITIAVLIAFSLTGASVSRPLKSNQDSYFVCRIDGITAISVILGVLGVVYLAGSYMIFRILILGREGGFNESRAIAFAIYNVVFVLVVFMVVNRSLDSPDKYFGLMSFSQLWFVLCPLISLFGPPFYRLFSRRQAETKFGSVPMAQYPTIQELRTTNNTSESNNKLSTSNEASQNDSGY